MNDENDNEKEYYGKIDGKRLKPIENYQAINIMNTDWKPYELSGEQIPNFLKPYAEESGWKVYASGYRGPDYKTFNNEYGYPLAGGLRVIRHSGGNPSGINWKAYDYKIFRDNATGSQYLVGGPYNHPTEHHMEEFPEDYKGIEVLKFNFPKCPLCGKELDELTLECHECNWSIQSK